MSEQTLSLVHGQPTEISGTRKSLAPTNLIEAMEFSKLLSTSNFVPKDFQGKPGDILVAVQWGMEIGLAPLQALQNIAVINGRPTIWGDAALGIVQAHPEYVRHEEGVRGVGDAMIGWHTITRKGQQPHTVEFSVADARKANLWDKAGPWKQYPSRMLKLRARGWAIRDKFADALKGIITREEALDTPTEEGDDIVPQSRPDPVITLGQANEFYQTWKNVGNHSIDEAKAFLLEKYGLTSSMEIPFSAFSDCMEWAKNPTIEPEPLKAHEPKGEVISPNASASLEKTENVTASAEPEDMFLMNRLEQLFDIDGTKPKVRESLKKEYAGRIKDLVYKLESSLSQD